jgi:hypothetical protein
MKYRVYAESLILYSTIIEADSPGEAEEMLDNHMDYTEWSVEKVYDKEILYDQTEDVSDE